MTIEPDTFEKLGLKCPELMLPRAGTDLGKWAVVACDQYTSQPEYWEAAAALIGDAPSTRLDPLASVAEENMTLRTFPLRVRRWEMLSDITVANRTVDRVGKGV